MKFRSPTDTPVYMALTNGHTCVVGPDLTEVPDMFRRKAIAEGCLAEGETAAQAEAVQATRKIDLIRNAMQRMIADAEESDFNNDGKPDLRKLSKRAGFEVSRDERDEAWQDMADD